MLSQDPKLILEVINAIDRQGNKFIILRTNPDKYYIFDSLIPEDKWGEFEKDKEYYLDYIINKKTGNKVVKGFKKIEVIKYGQGEIRIVK